MHQCPVTSVSLDSFRSPAWGAGVMKLVLAFAVGLIGLDPVFAAANASAGDSYRFEVVRPADRAVRGSVLVVRVIHSPGDHIITDAEVFRREMEFRHKAVPAITERRTRLQSDGHGNYQLTTPYDLTPGASLKLEARLRGSGNVIRGSATVPE